MILPKLMYSKTEKSLTLILTLQAKQLKTVFARAHKSKGKSKDVSVCVYVCLCVRSDTLCIRKFKH